MQQYYPRQVPVWAHVLHGLCRGLAVAQSYCFFAGLHLFVINSTKYLSLELTHLQVATNPASHCQKKILVTLVLHY
jgi:hypothetical protein